MRWKTCWKSISAGMRTTKFWSVLDETSKQQSLPSATTGGERDAPAASGPAWGGGLLRLRIRAQRDALLPRLISGEICVDSL